MLNMVGFIDPAQVSANAGSLTERSHLVANRTETATQPPRSTTLTLETGPVQLVMKSSRPTQFPCRKARESSTVSTGSNRKFPIVAPPPPPSVSGKIGEEFPDCESEPRMFRFNNSKFVGLAITVRLEAIPKPVLRLIIHSRQDPLEAGQLGIICEYHSLVTRLPTRRWQCRWGGKAMSLWVSHVSLAVPCRWGDDTVCARRTCYEICELHVSLAVPACELWSSVPRLDYSSLDADALLSPMLGCYLRPEATLVWIVGRFCQNFGRMSRVFSKWARHWGDVGTKTESAPVSGEISGRVLSAWYQSIRTMSTRKARTRGRGRRWGPNPPPPSPPPSPSPPHSPPVPSPPPSPPAKPIHTHDDYSFAREA
ncbi:unnamed protein product [Prunus armeniaca]